MIKEKIYEKKGVKLSNSPFVCDVVIFMTNVYPYLIEIKKEGGYSEYIHIFGEDSLSNFLKMNGLLEDFVNRNKNKEIDVFEQLDEMFSEDPTFFRFDFIPVVGDVVISKVYLGKRKGVVRLIEYSGRRRIPLCLVEWEDGARTYELPTNLRLAVGEKKETSNE
mgnify:CR=1 FL=1